MLLRNKAPTWYRADGVAIGPGQIAELSEHEGLKLLEKLPWHFERIAKPTVAAGESKAQHEQSAGQIPGHGSRRRCSVSGGA